MANEMMLHDDRDTIIAGLREQLRQTREELAAALASKGQVERGAQALRKALAPFYGALRFIFDETEGMGIAEVQTQTASPQKSAAWESWKQKLGPGSAAAKIIDMLHVHGALDQTQIRIHLGTSRMQTVYDAVSKLNRAGIINKNGGKISLKEL